MKRIIWAIAAGVLLLSGCQGKSKYDMDDSVSVKLGSMLKTAECNLIYEITNIQETSFPMDIETAQNRKAYLTAYIEHIKSMEFVFEETRKLNEDKIEIASAEMVLTNKFIETPQEQWTSSPEIRQMQRDLLAKTLNLIDKLATCN